MLLVTQSCPALCNPLDYSLPGFSNHGIFQTRILEWIAISFSRGSCRPRDWTQGFLGAWQVKNPPAVWEIWVRTVGWEDPLEKEWLLTPVFWLENPMDHIVHGVTKSQTRLSNFHFLSPAVQGGSLPYEPPGKSKITKLFQRQNQNRIHITGVSF